jgi:hypothetical protein
MGANCVEVIVQQLILFVGQGIKVAILALAAAKGNMDIDSQRLFISIGIE